MTHSSHLSHVEQERRLFGMVLRLIAMAVVSVMFASVKLVETRGVNLVETIFFRQLFALMPVTAWIAFTSGLSAVKTQRIGAHMSRTAMGLTGMSINFWGYILLPLAEATTIGFTMPMFATILSALVLKEKTGIHRWSAVVLGFIGVLVMVRPDGAHFPLLGASVSLAAAFMTACISIMLRQLGKTEGAAVTVFWFTLLSLPPLGVLMIFFAQPHDLVTWGILLLMGLTGGLAQLCMTGALRWAPVSVVLPMDYSSILWATLLGWLFWNQWPLATTWIGAMLIIASGFYIAWRERIRLQRLRANMTGDALG